MKLLALVGDAYGGGGGIAQSNRDLFEALASSGSAECITVLPRYAGAFNASDLPKSVIQREPSKNKFIYSLRAALYVMSGKYDLIFCGHLYMAPLAYWLSRCSGVRYWVHLHGIEAWAKPVRSVVCSVENASWITAVSRYTRRRFMRWADVADNKVRILPNTVDERFSPGKKPDKLLNKLDLSGKKILLTVARLSSKDKYKGHDRVIAVLPEILRVHPELVYLIAGEGDDKPRLESLARAAGVDRVVYFLGQPSSDELPDIYRMADIFVMPSTGEGFGIAFLEALSCGLAVIGGDGDGCSDPLRDGKSGLLIDPFSKKALNDAIISLLDTKTKLVPSPAIFSRDNYRTYLFTLFSHISFESKAQI